MVTILCMLSECCVCVCVLARGGQRFRWVYLARRSLMVWRVVMACTPAFLCSPEPCECVCVMNMNTCPKMRASLATHSIGTRSVRFSVYTRSPLYAKHKALVTTRVRVASVRADVRVCLGASAAPLNRSPIYTFHTSQLPVGIIRNATTTSSSSCTCLRGRTQRRPCSSSRPPPLCAAKSRPPRHTHTHTAQTRLASVFLTQECQCQSHTRAHTYRHRNRHRTAPYNIYFANFRDISGKTSVR